jgi:hypothetical protein
MRPVYDEFREELTVRIMGWVVSLALGLGMGAAAGPGQAQNQPQPAPAAPMGGMDMSQDKAMDMGHGKAMDMNMCRCKCLGMGQGMEMHMGQGKGMGMDMDMGQSKPMNMDHGKAMSPGKDKPSVPAGPLKITFGDKSAEWTPAALAALPHKTETAYNGHVKACQAYSGVLLIDLLTRLGVAEKPHGKDLRLYLVAEGADGYKAVYAVAEVNPDVNEATVLVADAMDGKSLDENGPLQLVATGEKRPARWVRNLVSIRVLTAD